MPKLMVKFKARLLIALTGTAIILACLIALLINTSKPYLVRAIDNIFIAASMLLLFALGARIYMRSLKKKAFGRSNREFTRQMSRERRKANNKYNFWQLLVTHFEWSALVLFLLSAIGTVAVVFVRI